MHRLRIEADDVRVGGELRLEDEAAHYLTNVLRCDEGERIELFDGRGGAWLATLVDASRARVRVEERLDTGGVEAPRHVTLYQTMPKRDRFEWALEKTTELGVDRIVPIESQRSVVRIPADRAEKKVARWRKIVTSAARQSGRVVVPEITEPRPIERALAESDPAVDHLFLDPDADASIGGVLSAAGPIAVWIGPEGGFTEAEITALREIGTGVSVGRRVLRSETAGVIAVALVQEHSGGLDR